jgi:ribosomal protein S18 acetylase RimI-like enzyme
MTYRAVLAESDAGHIEAVTRATGFFSDEEVGIARELAEENLSKGEVVSGYHFLVLDTADSDGLDAFACFGPVPGTKTSFDLYWIVVSPAAQGRGVGRRLLGAVETRIRAAGGKQIYADTSSRALYAPTRAFYERTGFVQVALLPDFYDEGDGKVVYMKRT